MATYVKFQQFVGDLGTKVHNLNTDTIKVMLTNTAPNAATNTVKADLTEISAGNGYTAGGFDIQNTYSQTSGTGSLAAVDVTITASGGSIGPFRYAVWYNDTPTSPADPLIGYADYGSSITLADGEDLLVDFPATLATFA